MLIQSRSQMRLKVVSNRLHQGFRLWPALHHEAGGKQRHAASGQLNPSTLAREGLAATEGSPR